MTGKYTLHTALAALSTGDPDTREAAASALQRAGSAAVPLLVGVDETAHRWMRWYAARILGRIGDVSATPHLRKALRDRDGGVRLQAALALGHISTADGVPDLLDTLANDRSVGVRWAAAEALTHIGAHAVPGLMALLRHGNISTRWYAAQALDRIGWQPGDDEQRADHTLAAQRWSALEALGAAARPALESRLKDEDRSWTADEQVSEIAASLLRRIVD